MNLSEILKSGAESGNVQEKLDAAQGDHYVDKVDADTDTMAKLPQSSMPQGQDPNPFTVGPLKK